MSLKNRIVLVPFPFDDFTGMKVRPALCLTDEIGHYKHVIIAFITSVLPDMPEESDLMIVPGIPDFFKTGLRVPSAVRLHRIVTIPESLILRDLGVLPSNMQKEVRLRLQTMFG